MKRQLSLAIAALLAAAAWPLSAAAQNVTQSRAMILSIDQDRQTVELRDPKGHQGTWRFNNTATVKFTDGGAFFPNPSVKDLRPPMYVHFTAKDGVIDAFDVVELGFQPGNEQSGETSASDRKQSGTSRSITGRVTSYDPNVRQVEIEHGGLRETFQLTDRTNQQLNPGDRVRIQTAWTGQTELVSNLQVLGGGAAAGVPGGTGARARGRGRGSDQGVQSVQGQVVRITSRGVVMQVAGAEQTYTVQDSRLLQRLRVGDTVQFDWTTDRNGRMTITNVR